MKKKIITGVLIACVIAAIIYTFVSLFLIPKIAVLLIPTRWKNIPLHEKRPVYTSYLGDSNNTDSLWKEKGDTWIVTKGNYEYSMRIKYDRDSLARVVNIQYRFENLFLTKIGYLLTDS